MVLSLLAFSVLGIQGLDADSARTAAKRWRSAFAQPYGGYEPQLLKPQASIDSLREHVAAGDGTHLWIAEYPDCSVVLAKSDGKFSSFRALASPSMLWPTNPVPVETVKARINEVFRRLDYPGELDIWSVQRQDGSSDGAKWIGHAFRIVRGVDLGVYSQVVFEAAADSGEILMFLVMDSPKLPASAAPKVSAEDARAVLVSAIFQKGRMSTIQEYNHGTRLAAWVPKTTGLAVMADLPPDADRLQVEKQSILVYEGRFEEVEKTYPWGAHPIWHGVVDALTGKLLLLEKPDTPLGSGPADTPTTPTIKPGKVTLIARGKAKTVGGAAVAAVEGKGKPAGGQELVLSQGKKCLAATFDPKAKLLWLGPRAVRPNAPLLKAIQALLKG